MLSLKNGKYKLKFHTKLWLTPGLQKSNSIKKKLSLKYIRMKDHDKKLELHKSYENH